MSVVCVLAGPSVELLREDAGVRWCFGCRAHLPHADVLLHDHHVPMLEGEEPSWYEPVRVRRCSRCGKDRTAFPGTSW